MDNSQKIFYLNNEIKYFNIDLNNQVIDVKILQYNITKLQCNIDLLIDNLSINDTIPNCIEKLNKTISAKKNIADQ